MDLTEKQGTVGSFSGVSYLRLPEFSTTYVVVHMDFSMYLHYIRFYSRELQIKLCFSTNSCKNLCLRTQESRYFIHYLP